MENTNDVYRRARFNRLTLFVTLIALYLYAIVCGPEKSITFTVKNISSYSFLLFFVFLLFFLRFSFVLDSISNATIKLLLHQHFTMLENNCNSILKCIFLPMLRRMFQVKKCNTSNRFIFLVELHPCFLCIECSW